MNYKSLTEEETQELRDAYKKGDTIVSLSNRFGISRPTVYRVLEDDYIPRSSNIGMKRASEEAIERMNETLTEIMGLLNELLYVLRECDLHVRLEGNRCGGLLRM